MDPRQPEFVVGWKKELRWLSWSPVKSREVESDTWTAKIAHTRKRTQMLVLAVMVCVEITCLVELSLCVAGNTQRG